MALANPRVFRFALGLMLAVIGALLLIAGLASALALLTRPDVPARLQPVAATYLSIGALALWAGRRWMRQAQR